MSLPKTGYHGQKYVVTYEDPDGKRRVFGWLNNADGQPFVNAIELHPSMDKPEVHEADAEGNPKCLTKNPNEKK